VKRVFIQAPSFIVFQLVQHDGTEAILLLSVGTHDEVY
jgi:hypothetical protein